MKAPVILTWCDPCAKEGTMQVPATELRVGMMGRPFTIDMCDLHEKKILGPIRDVLEQFSRGVVPPQLVRQPAAPTRPRTVGVQQALPMGELPVVVTGEDGKIECPSCGRRYPRATMNDHIYKTEKVTRPDLGPCIDCGYEASDRRALGFHRSQVHGADSVAEALQLLRVKMGG